MNSGLYLTLAGSPATVYQFQYGQDGHLLEELSGGVAKADYIYLGDMPVGTITPATGAVSFLLDDRLNTPRVATDSTGATVLWKNVTTPFGIPNTSGALQQNLRFPGQNADANAGWVHNGFRDYMPAWGRYLESDPIGIAGGINTFGYVGQNPLRFVDSRGLQAAPPIIGGPFPIYIPLVAIPGTRQHQQWTKAAWQAWQNLQTEAGNLSDWVGNVLANKSSESEPKDCPRGTRPIDKVRNLSKDDIHTIKDSVYAGPKDWTGISPEGNVITSDPEGNAINHGPVENHLP